MTWPFENDTSAITKKLAKRNLKADKSRNILIIITIALATCLIMTTTLYFFASQRKSLNDAAGRYQAIINEVDNDTITKLVNDSRVQVGVSHLLGLVSYGDYKLTVRSMDETLMKLAKYPDLEGELPKSMEMSRNVQSGNTQNLKSMVIQRSFPKWSVAERRKTAAASDQAAVCACAHSRYFAGGSPSGLRV